MAVFICECFSGGEGGEDGRGGGGGRGEDVEICFCKKKEKKLFVCDAVLLCLASTIYRNAINLVWCSFSTVGE